MGCPESNCLKTQPPTDQSETLLCSWCPNCTESRKRPNHSTSSNSHVQRKQRRFFWDKNPHHRRESLKKGKPRVVGTLAIKACPGVPQKTEKAKHCVAFFFRSLQNIVTWTFFYLQRIPDQLWNPVPSLQARQSQLGHVLPPQISKVSTQQLPV